MAGRSLIVSEDSEVAIALAGETTAARLRIRFLGNLRVAAAIAGTLAAFGAGYGSWERLGRCNSWGRVSANRIPEGFPAGPPAA